MVPLWSRFNEVAMPARSCCQPSRLAERTINKVRTIVALARWQQWQQRERRSESSNLQNSIFFTQLNYRPASKIIEQGSVQTWERTWILDVARSAEAPSSFASAPYPHSRTARQRQDRIRFFSQTRRTDTVDSGGVHAGNWPKDSSRRAHEPGADSNRCNVQNSALVSTCIGVVFPEL
jgi:hypothetical protein